MTNSELKKRIEMDLGQLIDTQAQLKSIDMGREVNDHGGRYKSFKIIKIGGLWVALNMDLKFVAAAKLQSDLVTKLQAN